MHTFHWIHGERSSQSFFLRLIVKSHYFSIGLKRSVWQGDRKTCHTPQWEISRPYDSITVHARTRPQSHRMSREIISFLSCQNINWTVQYNFSCCSQFLLDRKKQTNKKQTSRQKYSKTIDIVCPVRGEYGSRCSKYHRHVAEVNNYSLKDHKSMFCGFKSSQRDIVW